VSIVLLSVFSQRRNGGGGSGNSHKRRASSNDVKMATFAVPAASGRASDIFSAVSIVTPDDEFFDEFSYKDIDALKELNCSMARKKEIRCEVNDE